jgi:hypothetical protein
MDQISRALLTVGGDATAPTYVEDVFSTYLYSGSPSNNTITNGIDLAGKGGLVWMKSRTDYTTSGYGHALYDTQRGNLSRLLSNTTEAASTGAGGTYMQSFNSNGFTLVGNGFLENYSTQMVSWTFRKQPKFFDVVTYTGNGSNRTIAHSLDSVPGCIIVKRTDTSAGWQVYHRSLANTEYMVLNSVAAKATGATRWNSTTPTSTEFSLGTDTTVNASGGTYVAYLFAHDAGGFGASGTDNVITCGSYIGNGTSQKLTFGWEPQWFLFKVAAGTTNNWQVADNMRGMPSGSAGRLLQPNLNGSENSGYTTSPEADGLTITGSAADINQSGLTYIYIAIRRGPMRTPTTGTSVYNTINRTGNGTATAVTGVGFSPDLVVATERAHTTSFANTFYDRQRGALKGLASNNTNSESSNANSLTGFDAMNGINLGPEGGASINYSGLGYTNWMFKRAPGFFDVVCYTGTGSATTFSHNLGVVPEMIIVKRRSSTDDWWVYDVATGNTKYQVLNSTATPTTSSTAWNNTTPTSSVFSVGTGTPVNASASTYVAYLFATVAGVSKVGSYTGNGSNQTINCGFTTGARFVLIKRTESTGDWYVWDSARGIVSANDPHLSLNTATAEVTTDDSLDPDNTGFIVNQLSATNINVTSATYIFLAIA